MLQATSTCWSGNFSFWNCCVLQLGCFDAEYTYDRCCNYEPLLSKGEVRTLVKGDLACTSLCGNLASDSPSQQCQTRKNAILRYSPTRDQLYTAMSVDEADKCPLATFSQVLSIAPDFSRNARWAHVLKTVRRYLDTVFAFVIRRLADVLLAGWSHLFLMMVPLESFRKFESRTCAVLAGEEVALHSNMEAHLHGEKALNVSAAQELLQGARAFCSADVPCCRISDDMKVLPRCCLAYATATLTIAQSVDDESLARQYLDQVGKYLGAMDADSRIDDMVCSKWKYFLRMVMDPPSTQMSVLALVGHLGFQGTVVSKLDVNFRMYLFREVELASQAMKLHRFPFCSNAFLLRLFLRIAQTCQVQDCSHWVFSYVEGGSHLGGCSLFGTAILRAANVRHRFVAIEAQPEVAKLLHKSVHSNAWGDMVNVVGMALGSESKKFTKIQFMPGLSAQGSTRWDSYTKLKYSAQEAAGLQSDRITVHTPVIALDDLLGSDQQFHILSLMLTGSDMDALHGARKLLHSDRWCAVIMRKDLMSIGGSSMKQFMDLFSSGGRGVDFFVFDSESSPISVDGVLDWVALDAAHPNDPRLLALSLAPSCAFIHALISATFVDAVK